MGRSSYLYSMKTSIDFIPLTGLGHVWEVVKLSDDMFNGLHPNGIVEGYSARGSVSDLRVGDGFCCGSLRTSPVIGIVSVDDGNREIIFKTINSTYKLSLLEKLPSFKFGIEFM